MSRADAVTEAEKIDADLDADPRMVEYSLC
jgi:hypothetical protein